MRHNKLPAPQEVMSISFENTQNHSTQLHVKWETTDEWVKIKVTSSRHFTCVHRERDGLQPVRRSLQNAIGFSAG